MRKLAHAARVLPRSIRWMGGIAAFVLAVALFVFWRLGPAPTHAAASNSRVVFDHQGRIVRAFTTEDGRWRLPVTLEQVDPQYVAMLLAFEDRRFYRHGGVDYRSMGRAVWQLARSGHAISGGSTITMQLARILESDPTRSVKTKFKQFVRAYQLEHGMSKAQILELYLKVAPFGGPIEGVRAASLAYFGKEPRHLSLAEAATLVALPQSPEQRRPDRFPDAARRARNKVLDRAAQAGVITVAEARRAKEQPLAARTLRPAIRRSAPQVADSAPGAEQKKPAISIAMIVLDRDGAEDDAAEDAKSSGDGGR